MGWVAAIIGVFVFFAFWRVTIPLAIICGVVLAGFLLNEKSERKDRERQREVAKAELHRKLAAARSDSKLEEKHWVVNFEEDPASGEKIARSAGIESKDGICSMTIERRISGTELTGLRCPGYKMDTYSDIEVKFDNVNTSKRMNIENYAGEFGSQDSVYFNQTGNGEYSSFPYNKFLGQLALSNTVAIRIPWESDFWVAFSLKGSAEMIGLLGKEQPFGD